MTVTKNLTRRKLFQVATGMGLFCVAGPLLGQQVYKEVSDLAPGEFTWHPERQPDGPVSVIVSLDEQRVHVYRNGLRIAVSTCSSGKPGHETPTGVFVVLQKDRDHRSSTYNNAPMPNMNRLTWDGIALHAGNLPGYPASHGCVRLPLEFSKLLFTVTHVGTPVIVANAHTAPDTVNHPGLILSGRAEGEFEQAVAALQGNKHPSDWIESELRPITSMIASSTDKEILILENDREVARGPLIWDGKPLGSQVYVLKGEGERAGHLHWEVLSYSDAAHGSDLDRVRSDDAFSKLMMKHAHPGMFFIFTDLPLHPDSRSGRDFVIMS